MEQLVCTGSNEPWPGPQLRVEGSRLNVSVREDCLEGRAVDFDLDFMVGPRLAGLELEDDKVAVWLFDQTINPPPHDRFRCTGWSKRERHFVKTPAASQ